MTPTLLGHEQAQERAAFESWVLSLEHWPETRSSGIFECSTAVPGMYYNSALDHMWRGWMARATASGSATQTRRCEWCGDIAQGHCGCPAEAEIERLKVAARQADDRTRALVLECLVQHGVVVMRNRVD